MDSEHINIIEEFKLKLKDAIVEEFNRQGHRLTGQSMEDTSVVVDFDGSRADVQVFSPASVAILNQGVSAERIPYERGSGAGHSLYIEALARYVERRMGIGGKKGLSVAFAIAESHKKEGMPTRNSSIYSENGRRIGFIDDMLEDDDNQSLINKFSLDLFNEVVDVVIENLVKVKQNGFNN